MFQDQGYNPPSPVQIKGRLNFSGAGQFTIFPHEILTLVDSSWKSRSTVGYRPAQESGDIWIGIDARPTGNDQNTSASGLLAYGAPGGIVEFANVVPNASGNSQSTNYIRRINSTNNTFNVNVIFGADNTYNIGAAGANRPKSLFVGSDVDFSAGILLSNTAPTISSGFGASPSVVNNNGTGAFTINVGTGGTASTGTIGLPAAAHGWYCTCEDVTTNSSSVFRCKQTAAGTTTTVPIGEFTAAGAAHAWTASDIVTLSCVAY